MQSKIREAFVWASQGFSADRVIVDPELNSQFIARCRELGLDDEARALNLRLMNARKSKWLQGLPRPRRTSVPRSSECCFAAEVAIRFLEHRDKVSLDHILCDPEKAAEFDQLASSIAPGFQLLQYRWSALYLRKAKLLRPELLSRVVPSSAMQLGRIDELDVTTIPLQPGIYVFYSAAATLYVGEADNLRRRIQKHLDHSDIKAVARWFWDHGTSEIRVELHVLPEGTPARVRKALEAELISSRKALFNIQRR
jgi:site-specific DNA-methyltransferase (adenine-specific)